MREDPLQHEDLFAPIQGPVRPDPEFEAIERAFRLDLRRRSQIMVLLAIALPLTIIAFTHGEKIQRNVRRAWFSWQAWSSDVPLAGVDLERVHGELLTNWVVARNEDEVAAETAFQALSDAIAPSPALGALFGTLHELAAPDRGLLKRNDELLDVVAAWNELLRNGGAPWWLEGNMLVGPGTAQFYLKTYRIRGTAVLMVGEERVVTRLLSRADRLNVVELALGHASPDRDHAALLLHRIRDHAMDVMWPALAPTATDVEVVEQPDTDLTEARPALSEAAAQRARVAARAQGSEDSVGVDTGVSIRGDDGAASGVAAEAVVTPLAADTAPRPTQRPAEDTSLVGRVRAEVRTALTDAEWHAVSSTARARGTLVRIRNHVTIQRRCGARLVLHMNKVEGPGKDTLRWLRSVAAREGQFECPALTPAHVAELENASRTLRATGGLQDALDRLVIWLARNVAVHEARHVADQRLHGGLERKLPCLQCPETFSVRSQAEFSAWMAEVAWGPSPFTTLLHACSVPRRSATGRALQVLLSRLGRDACGHPPVDVQRRARLLEQKIFGREERVHFISRLPDRMTQLGRK